MLPRPHANDVEYKRILERRLRHFRSARSCLISYMPFEEQ